MAEEKKATSQGRPYLLKKSAVRAAREAGMVDGQYELYQAVDKKSVTKQNPSGEMWYWKPTAAHTSIKEQLEEHKAKVEKKTEPPVKKLMCPHGIDTKQACPECVKERKAKENPPKPVEEEPARKLVVVDTTIGEKVPEELQTAAPAVPVVTTTPTVVKSATSNTPWRTMKVVPASEMPKDDGKLHKSQVGSPTKLVWDIADEMITKNPAVTRRQVIEECTRRGIAFYTARTQYQQWLTTRRESEENARQANSKSKNKK